MKFVFLSYHRSPEFTRPEQWIKRIRAYTGILECLSAAHTVISFELLNYVGTYQLNGVQYVFLKFNQAELRFPWRLHRCIANLQPDVVLVHGLHHPLQVLLLKLQLGNKPKIIVQNHAEKPGSGLKKWLQQKADERVDAYLFTSCEMGMDWVNKGNLADAKKIREVMEASSVFQPMDRKLARARTNAAGNPVFLWVGRLDANKDPLTVVNAFLQFAGHHSDARLYMIYHTDELLAQIDHMLSGKDNKDVIKFVGKVPHEEMGYWFNSADFIISGSHYEGSGVAVCEAMSCGCVPIVTNILAFRKITNKGACGLLYEPGNKTALFYALRQAIDLDREAARMKAIQQFNAELSFGAIARQIQDIAASL